VCKLGLITSYDSWVLREGCPIETLIKTNPIQLQILWIDTLPNQLLGFFINLYQLCGRDLILFILILARNLRSLLSSTQIWLVTQKLVPYGASWTCEDHCCLNYVCGHQDNSYSNTGFPAFMVVYPCLSLWWPVSLRKAVLLPYWTTPSIGPVHIQLLLAKTKRETYRLCFRILTWKKQWCLSTGKLDLDFSEKKKWWSLLIDWEFQG